MWVKESPKVEGWYMWIKTSKQRNDQWKWCAYFVTNDGKEFWENGTHVHPPIGGWWSNVPCGSPTALLKEGRQL